MSSSDSNHTQSASPASTDTEAPLKFEQALTEAETAVRDLRQRYEQLQTGPDLKQQLTSHRQSLAQEQAAITDQLQQISEVQARAQLRRQQETLHQDIQKVHEELFNLELDLESRIFRWYCRDKQEWFWQFLRYAGLGFGAALLLQGLLGR